jgi:hypothetical protein
MVLFVTLLLVHAVWMQTFDMLRIFELYLLRPRWLLANRILLEKLLPLLLCCWRDGHTLLRVCLSVLLALPGV